MTKIDIISGFLGAGKTTLIRKFIEEAFQGQKVVLIENEFGEIGVDSGFLKDAGVEIKEMNSGCICCSLVGDFETSLKEVVETYRPERIIIEPSGVGKLSDVIKAVESVGDDVDLALNHKLVVVNAKKCSMYVKNFGEFFINQVENADGIILSRTTGMEEEQLQGAINLLKEYNVSATIITTDWALIDGQAILDTIENQHLLEESLMEEMKHTHGGACGCGGHHHEHTHEEGCGCGGHHHEHTHEEGCGCGGHHHEHTHEEGCGCGGHHHEHTHEEGCGCGGHHHADDVFSSWGVETATKYEYDSVSKMLEALDNDAEYGVILRAKGMIACENNSWAYFDYVPGEVRVRKEKPCPTGKICVIGTNINQDNLKKLFQC